MMGCSCPPRRTIQHSVLSTDSYFTQRRTLIKPRRTVHLGVIYTEAYCPLRRTLHQGVVSTKAHCPPRRTLHQGVLSTYKYFTPRRTLHRGVPYAKGYCPPRRTVHCGGYRSQAGNLSVHQGVLHERGVISAGSQDARVVRQELGRRGVGGERFHLPVLSLQYGTRKKDCVTLLRQHTVSLWQYQRHHLKYDATTVVHFVSSRPQQNVR